MYLKLILCLLFTVCDCYEGIQELQPVAATLNTNDPADVMESTVYKTVTQFYCNYNNVNVQSYSSRFSESNKILYGTKAWTFPEQDVNLTLTYPVNNKRSKYNEEYIVTAFKVILYVGGVNTRGYIVDGGIMQEHISISFISQNITSLSYQFWLYGIPKTTLFSIPPISIVKGC